MIVSWREEIHSDYCFILLFIYFLNNKLILEDNLLNRLVTNCLINSLADKVADIYISV